MAIPWKEEDPKLPDNYGMALRRLCNTEKRLLKSPETAEAYSKNIIQYLEKGYIRKIDPAEEKPSRKWYLPHFPVVRPDRATTKTRIVFDASAKCDGISLNDVIYQGPKLQRDLNDVLLRFRRRPVALICDIAEMYLRIEVAPEDRSCQRFLWRSMDQQKEPEEFEFNRVVFGVNSSPFHAQFVSQFHAERHKDELPLAAETVSKSTYMDDSMDSMSDDSQGIELYRQLEELWNKAGMHARKWLSNSIKVLEKIPIEDRASEVDINEDPLPMVKTLGVTWLPEEDVFTFKANPPEETFQFTKRNFLRKIATLFDPIGFLAPFTIRAKIMMQEMWTAGLEWDELCPGELINKSREWFCELEELPVIKVSRCLRSGPEQVALSETLHTFVDASQDAYGAVIYSRVVYESGSVSTRLVAAKSKVAPLTTTSIPRLELLAAVLGLRLTESTSRVFSGALGQAVFWSDSMNVLWWLRGRSRRFKPFVANRVGEIQSLTNPKQWRYVSTHENPADLITRGMRISDMAKEEKWWNGPDFLQKEEPHWPVNRIETDLITEEKEIKKKAQDRQDSLQARSEDWAMVSVHDDDQLWRFDPKRFSSWLRLIRVQAWVRRFIDNCRSCKRESGQLKSEEIEDATFQVIRSAQRKAFPDEYLALQRQRELPKKSKLLGLRPWLDEEGQMRCDGRLKYAEFLPHDARFPIILPRKNCVTKLIVKHYHEKGNHAGGTNQTLATLSTRFWIICGREEIREWEKECNECQKRKAKAAKQVMAPLPQIRLRSSLRAFAQTAVDFGGPFVTVQGRRTRRQKRYLCLFTCLASRAVHLEMAYALDTDSFLNAFYRMVNRRGLPKEMLSDNGGNFVGANKELCDLVKELDQEKITKLTANQGVNWKFNPPLAPHFGGVHETMIKAAKRAIHAILGNADITDEELTTAFTGAEALLNSRPLTYQSANPEDDVPLTPNHFLFGQIGGQFAPESVDHTAFNPKKRWRRVQELVRHFWHRWIREWIPALNIRRKWLTTERDLQVGDVVLVISPNTPRGHWPLGRITEVFPGKDGHVRVAKVQVGRNELTRPISKLCQLELS